VRSRSTQAWRFGPCWLACALVSNLAACGAADGTSPDAAAGSGGSESIVDAATMKLLARHAYDAASPPPDASNRVGDDPLAQRFGQQLFFETSLSGRLLDRDNDGTASTLGIAGEAGRVSCAGCHVPATGFVDTRSPHRQISLAAQWTKRRAPTLLEVGFLPVFNWDGRRDTLWNQALGVMESSQEFNSGRLFIAGQIFKKFRAEYEQIFGPMPPLDDPARFPRLDPLEVGCDAGPVQTARCRGKPGDGADYDGMTPEDQRAVTTVAVNVAKAIAAYQRLLRCGPGRFDRWLAGDSVALSESEQRGAALFVGAGKCASCHVGPTFSDGKFHNVGLRPATVAVAFTDTGDRGAGEGVALSLGDPLNGRGAFSDGDPGTLPASAGPELEGAFRTPSLRCISTQPSFMHTGQHKSLASVVQFFNRGGDPAGYPGTNELAPLALTDEQKADLVAFIGALQGPGPDAALMAPASSE
jgi:cytochrome c peroxidase